jgi:hypothetical protein
MNTLDHKLGRISTLDIVRMLKELIDIAEEFEIIDKPLALLFHMILFLSTLQRCNIHCESEGDAQHQISEHHASHSGFGSRKKKSRSLFQHQLSHLLGAKTNKHGVIKCAAAGRGEGHNLSRETQLATPVKFLLQFLFER